MYVRPERRRWGLPVLLALTVSLALGLLRADPSEPLQPAAGTDSSPAAPPEPAPLVLDDIPEPMVEKHPRTEADQDRLEALALFASGRMLQRQEKGAEAMRHYQRALRSDPQALSVAQAIIPLAFHLGRHAEAVRYALKAVEMEEPDPLLSERLGAYLIDIGDFKGAVALFEKAASARDPEKTTDDDVRFQMELGRLYHLTQQYDKAADCFAQVLKALKEPEKHGIDPKLEKLLLSDPGLTYNLMGDCFLRAGRLDEATAAFQQSHQSAPNEGLLDFNLAQVHAQRKELEKAIEKLQSCFREHLASEGTAPYELLANVLDDLGKKEELIDRLEEAQADDPKNVPLGYFLAETYLKAGKLQKAELLYRALLKHSPTLTGYRRLIEVCRQSGRTEALLAVLGEAVAKAGTLEPLGSEAQSVVHDADLLRSLVELARSIYEADPEKLDYGQRLAVAQLTLENEQFDLAGEFFDLAVQAAPDQAGELYLVWGVGLLLGDRFDESAKVFQRAIDQKAMPADNPVFSYYLAGALAMAGRTEEAIKAIEQAVGVSQAAADKAAQEATAAEKVALAAKEPQQRAHAVQQAALAMAKATRKKEDLVRFRSRQAWVLYHAKRNEEAIRAYRQLIDQYDADHESSAIRDELREVRLALSNLSVLNEDLAEAEEWLQQVLDEFPDDVGASNDLGYLWADQRKHLYRALRMIQHAVDAEPDNVAYRDSLGWIYYRLGQYTQAVAELEKAAERPEQGGETEPDAVILDHLGDAYQQANQPEKAREAWRRAVEAFHREEEAEKAQAVQQKLD